MFHRAGSSGRNLYSENNGLQSRLDIGYPTEILHGIPQPLQENARLVHRSGHYRCLPYHFQFINHPTIRRYIV
jgi:hypothetical protein